MSSLRNLRVYDKKRNNYHGKKAKKVKTGNGLELKIVNPDAAGIDISPTEMQVCVPLRVGYQKYQIL
jgi:hypothetical protein